MVELYRTVCMSVVYQYGDAGRLFLHDYLYGTDPVCAASGLCTAGTDSNLAVSRKKRLSQQMAAVFQLRILSCAFVNIGPDKSTVKTNTALIVVMK